MENLHHRSYPSLVFLRWRPIVALALGAYFAAAAPPSASWVSTWGDEFSGVGLDASHWKSGVLPWGGRHHNDQYASYIMPEDSYVDHGWLVLRSRKGNTATAFGGYPYSEGFVFTDGLLNYSHGYVEIRSTMATGKGNWPAFWMLSTGWPPEFDIAEYFGTDDRMHMGLAHGTCCPATWDSQSFYSLGVSTPHSFGLEWGPGYAIWYMDGRQMRAIYSDYVPDQSMYLILNSGTRWEADSTSTFPNQFRVDYARYYPSGTAVNDATIGAGLGTFKFNGSWLYNGTQGGAFFNDNHWSVTPGDSYQVSFRGVRIDLFAARDVVHGIAGVSVDSGPETLVDFYAPTRMDMALVWSSPWLNLGMHTLKVRVTGRKNASSGGTAIPADRVDFWSVPIRTDGQLNGSVIGTPGSWNQDGSTITNVFDGSLVDFFDAPVGSGSWVGLDLGPGAAQVVTHIRFAPRPGFADRMTSGHFEGANTPDFAHPVPLLVVSNPPPEETMSGEDVPEQPAVRYLRYIGPPGGFCNVAELEFFGRVQVPLPLQAIPGAAEISLSWTAIPGAIAYSLLRSDGTNGAWMPLLTTVGTNVVDTSVSPGDVYSYQVKGLGPSGGLNQTVVAGPVMPHGLPKLTAVLRPNGVRLSWPGWAPDFTLMSTTNANSSGFWTPVGTPAPMASDGNWIVDQPLDGGRARFYRLRR